MTRRAIYGGPSVAAVGDAGGAVSLTDLRDGRMVFVTAAFQGAADNGVAAMVGRCSLTLSNPC